jgi:Ca2+-binding EF-hand superfamily protein
MKFSRTHSPSKLVLGAALAIALGSYSSIQAQERGSRGEEAFAAADTNGDGLVTFDEFSSADSNPLERLDSDANGALTLDEFLNARPPRDHRPEQRTPEELSAEQQERLAKREAMRLERHAKLEADAQERFAELDSNGDEVVSAAEFIEARFLRLDADNNGALTLEELQAAAPKQRGRGRGDRRGGRGERG